MSTMLDPVSLPKGCGRPAAEWPQTPLRVRLQVLTLRKRLEALEARLHQNSSHSSRPPSTDVPAIKRQRRMQAAERHKPGAQPGHPGHQQVFLEPTATITLFPEVCAGGHAGFADVTLYDTHQVLEFPVMRPEVTHWQLHAGRCLSCGTLCNALLSSDQVHGYGPRLTGFVGERAGMVGARRSAGQDLCASVLGIPRSQGAIQTIVDRVSEAILPHDPAMGDAARMASGQLHG